MRGEIMQNVNVSQLVNQVAAIVTQVIGYGLLLLIAAAVVNRYGVRVPYIPTINATELAWLAGAWWLYRGGKL